MQLYFLNADSTLRAVSAANPLPVTGGGGGGGGGGDVNLTQIGGTAVAAGTGTVSAGVQRITLATDDAVNTALTAISETQGAISDVAYSGADATIAAMTRAIADAAISQSPALVQGAPAASYKSNAVDETEDLVSNAPCVIDDFFLYNPGSATGHLKFYDADDVADVVVGTTVPIRTYPLGAGKAMHPTGLNIACNNGLVIAATLNYADSDTTAPQTDMIVNIGYRA